MGMSLAVAAPRGGAVYMLRSCIYSQQRSGGNVGMKVIAVVSKARDARRCGVVQLGNKDDKMQGQDGGVQI